jgi:hypothetical protein
VRIRIALSTAVAVIVSTAGVFLLLGSTPAASARNTIAHHQAHVSHHTKLSKAQLQFLNYVGQEMSMEKAFLTALAAAPPKPVVAAAPAPAPVPVAVPVAAPVAAASDATTVNTGDWNCIRVHESGNRYNDSSAPSGAYGILASTWHSFGFSGWPYQAAPAVQDALALRLYSMYGFHPWSSRFACGL